MTEHLPECSGTAGLIAPVPKGCICDRLRACEQRVLAEREADGPWFRSVVHDCCVDKQTAYAAGLDAAREAVAAKAMHSPKCFALLPDFDERDCNCAVAYSLAAIDALREEQK